MTYIYDWFSFPQYFSVSCPKCGAEARANELPNLKNVNNQVVRYKPEVVSGAFKCEVSCLKCGYQSDSTNIHWADDAYWRFDVRGKVLWAWSKEHALTIRDYLASTDRREDEFGIYRISLLHLPKHFKLSKHRTAAVKSINNVIAQCT